MLFLLVACGPRPPSLNPPLPSSLPARYENALNPDLTRITGPWWKTFQDETLNQLVEGLLSSSLDLEEALARIEEKRALYHEALAARFPRLDFSFRGERQKTVVLAPYFRGGGFITGRFTGSLAASYEVDLWQKLSRASRAARLRLLAEEENRLALAQSLIAELVSRYLEGAFLSCELKVLREEFAIQKEYVRALGKRYEAGLVAPSILENERRLLASLGEEIPRLKAEIATRKQQLALLLGHYPSLKETNFSTCSLRLPPPPPGLPSSLLLRRPDIRAARARLLAAAEEVAGARAARFPEISLTASEGRLSNALNTLLRRRNRFWDLAFAVVQPLFDAGQRKAREEAARARARALAISYARTVLQAFFEVENALLLERHWRERLSWAEEQEKAACQDEKIKALRYRLGTVSVLDYLKAKHLCVERRRHTLATRKALLLNRVSLYRALGGGWPEQKR